MIEILPLDFLGQGAMLTPVDAKLHDLAIDFCSRELSEEVNLAELSKVWVAIDSGTVVGIMGWVPKPDVPIMRAIDEKALSLMAERLQSFFADQGCRGKEVLIHLSRKETPEQRCPGWKNVLVGEQHAESADRYAVKVR